MVIAHFDIDAFYAGAAELRRPELRGKAVIISHQSRRSVVLTASYEARRFGARSAMPLYRALDLCPHAIVVEPDFGLYRELSGAVFEILTRDDLPFEPLSLDEAYLQLGEMPHSDAVSYAQALRAAVFGTTGLTISAGIGSSKLIAKVASDRAKPNGCLAIEDGKEAAFLAPLPIGQLYGVGPKTEAHLLENGIDTIGRLAELDDAAVYRILGRHGQSYRALAQGIDGRRVESSRERRSLSQETTFDRDLHGDTALLPTLYQQSQDLAADLERLGLRGNVVAVKVKRSDFRVFGKQTQLREPTRDARVIYAAARYCLRERGLNEMSIRLLGIRIGGLTADTTRQLPLWS